MLPSANDVAFDDTRQLRWSDLGETAALVEAAHEATARYLAENAP